MIRLRRAIASTTLLAVLAGTGVASAQHPPTIWHGLGIPQGFTKFRDTKFNKKGNHPGLERVAPLKRIADPANLLSDVPAIKAAAEIKTQEDLAPQKIKAIKYLATIGCGCYGGVGEALAAALEDCTEEVRYEAALALYQAVNCKCDVCSGTCCTKELAAKMYERAYNRDANGCYLEPSARVRGVLVQVLASCPPDIRDIYLPATTEDIDPIIDRPPMPTPPIIDRPSAQNELRPTPAAPLAKGQTAVRVSSRRTWQNTQASATETVAQETAPRMTFDTTPATSSASVFAPPPVATVPKMVHGEVFEKSARGYARIDFHSKIVPPVGAEVKVYHDYLLGTEFMGTLIIVDYEGQTAIAAPRRFETVKVAAGDTVECSIQVPAPPAPMPVVVGQQAATSEPAPPVNLPIGDEAASSVVPVEHRESTSPDYFAPAE